MVSSLRLLCSIQLRTAIIENPIGFVGNLVGAVKRGFQQFSSNILTHLQAGLIGWLFGALAGAGLQLPERFDLRGIVSLVMQILGLTYQRLRGILVRLLGSEERVQRAEQVFDFLVTLVRDGIAAAWERIVEFAGNLQEMVLGGIRDWVARTVVGQAIARLVTLFNPAGAVIQAIMAIYNTVVFFIERAQQIGALVEAVFDSIASIAAGNIGAAASYVERTMARTIPVILGFLARFIGLGNVGEHIQNVIRRIQAPIENAMNRVTDWIATQVRRLGGAVMRGARSVGERILNWWRERRRLRTADGQQHDLYFQQMGVSKTLILASRPRPVTEHLNEVINDSNFDAATKARAEKALKFYQSRIEPITTIQTRSSLPPDLKSLVDNLPTNLTELSQELMQIGQGSIGDVPNQAVWKFTAVPKAATVELLSFRTSRGGTPARNGNPKGWNLITSKGLTSTRGNWVRMHLITAAIGGHDTDRNLLPAPTAVNTGSEVRGFETQLEELVYGAANPRQRGTNPSIFRQLNRPTVAWANVSTTGFHPAHTDPVSGILLYDDTTFATGVRMEAGIHYLSGGEWVKDPTPQLRAAPSIPAPDFSGTYIPNFNAIGNVIMQRVTNIPRHFADEFIAAKNRKGSFNSIAHFIASIFADRRSRNVEITEEFRDAVRKVSTATIENKIKWRD